MEEKTLTFEERLDKLYETAKKKKNVLEEQEILDAQLHLTGGATC